MNRAAMRARRNMAIKIPRVPDDSRRMTVTSPLHRHAIRVIAVLAFTGYAAVMAPLVRQDLQIATLGDTLELKRREVDAQLEQNEHELQTVRKRHDDIAYLKEERRILHLQGIQATREFDSWKIRRDLWSRIYWAAFALAHVILLPLGLWALAAASSQAPTTRSRPASTPRKRNPRTPRSTPPRLVEGTNP